MVLVLFLLLMDLAWMQRHYSCPNQRVYSPRIEAWWECQGDAFDCLEELEIKLAKIERYNCPEVCVVAERRGSTRMQVQLLRSRYLHYLLPRPNLRNDRNSCSPKWTRTMEIIGNSIRQAAKDSCIIDKDLLRHLKYLVSEKETKCPLGSQRHYLQSVMSSRERAWLWRRRWASRRTPVLEGSRHDRQMLWLGRRYPGIVPEASLVPRLPIGMLRLLTVIIRDLVG